VRGRGERLIAREDLVQLPLDGGEVGGVAVLRVRAKPDQELRPVGIDDLGVEVAERVPRLDRVLKDPLATRVDEDLDPARGLPERDRLPLPF